MAGESEGAAVLRVVAGLFGLVTWLGFLALQRIWRVSLGWVFTTLADLLDAVKIGLPHLGSVKPFGHVAAWLRSLSQNVYSLLGRLALDSEHQAVWLFSRLQLAYRWTGREIEGLARDALTQLLRTIYVYIPHLIRRAVVGLVRKAYDLARGFVKLEVKVAKLAFRFGKSLAHQLANEARHFAWFVKLEKALASKLLSLSRSVSKRLIHLTNSLVPKRFRALLYAALPFLGLAWLLGQNVKRLGKEILHWSHDALTWFLRYFGRLTDPHSIEDLTREAQGLVGVMVKELDFILTEFHAERLAPGPVDEPPIT